MYVRRDGGEPMRQAVERSGKTLTDLARESKGAFSMKMLAALCTTEAWGRERTRDAKAHAIAKALDVPVNTLFMEVPGSGQARLRPGARLRGTMKPNGDGSFELDATVVG